MATNVKRVSPAEAHELCGQGYAYVDVRSEQEFQQGHPAGAYNVPLMHAGAGGMTPNPDFVAVMSANFAPDARLVLGCRSGQRSMRAAEALIAAGFSGLVEQRAGFDGPRDAFGVVTEKGWSPAGLPVSREAESGRAYGALKARKG
jgi:rhodanese-related sulfurtransferase